MIEPWAIEEVPLPLCMPSTSNGFSSLDLYIQAAWADSKTKAFSLTAAAKLTLPDGLPLPAPPRYKTVYNNEADSGWGFNVSEGDSEVFPFTEYRTR